MYPCECACFEVKAGNLNTHTHRHTRTSTNEDLVGKGFVLLQFQLPIEPYVKVSAGYIKARKKAMNHKNCK